MTLTSLRLLCLILGLGIIAVSFSMAWFLVVSPRDCRFAQVEPWDGGLVFHLSGGRACERVVVLGPVALANHFGFQLRGDAYDSNFDITPQQLLAILPEKENE